MIWLMVCFQYSCPDPFTFNDKSFYIFLLIFGICFRFIHSNSAIGHSNCLDCAGLSVRWKVLALPPFTWVSHVQPVLSGYPGLATWARLDQSTSFPRTFLFNWNWGKWVSSPEWKKKRTVKFGTCNWLLAAMGSITPLALRKDDTAGRKEKRWWYLKTWFLVFHFWVKESDRESVIYFKWSNGHEVVGSRERRQGRQLRDDLNHSH